MPRPQVVPLGRSLGLSSVLAAVAFAVFCAALCPTSALAHAGQAEGKLPLLNAQGELVAAATSWGIVAVEDGCARRTCEEAVQDNPRWYYFATDGRILLGAAGGIRVTTDLGCSYAPGPAPLSEAPVLVGVGDGEHLVVGTSHPDFADNKLYVSHDEGGSFAEIYAYPGVSPTSLRVTDGGQHIVLGGVRIPETAPFVASSTDGGETWTVNDTWPENVRAVNVLGFDEDGRVALALNNVMGATLLRLVEDDLVTGVDVGQFPGAMYGFLAYAGYHFVTDLLTLYRAPSGSDAPAFTVVEDGPARCLFTGADGRMWGCALAYDQEAHFLVSDDGLSFEAVLPGVSVDERLCPDDTPGYAECIDRLELTPNPSFGECTLLVDGGVPFPAPPDAGGDGDGDSADGGDGDGDGDAGDVADDGDCACHIAATGNGAAGETVGPSAGLSAVALLAAASLRLRRRQPQRRRRPMAGPFHA